MFCKLNFSSLILPNKKFDQKYIRPVRILPKILEKNEVYYGCSRGGKNVTSGIGSCLELWSGAKRGSERVERHSKMTDWRRDRQSDKLINSWTGG